MALIPGFPDSRTISPSVRVAEVDQSFYGADTGASIPAVVGFAAKGPINVPTRVTDIDDLRKKFGYPDPAVPSYLLYCAEQLIQDATSLWVVRVADTKTGSPTEATLAKVVIPSAGRAAYIQTGIYDGAPIDLDTTNNRMRFRMNGTINEIDLTIPPGTYSSLVGEDGLRGAINRALGAAASVVAEDYYDSLSGRYYLRFRSSRVYGTDSSIELVSVENSAYQILQIGTEMTPATLTGTKDRYPEGSSLAEFNLASVPSPNLQVVVFGTGNPGIDGVAQVIHLPRLDGQTLSLVVDIINGDEEYAPGLRNRPLGFYASASGGFLQLTTGSLVGGSPHPMVGRDAQLIVRTASTVDQIFGLSNIGVRGTSPSGNVDGDTSRYGLVAGSSTGGHPGGSFTVTADSVGTFGNQTQVVVSTDPTQGTITIKVYNRGSYLETLSGMNKDETAEDVTYYIENVVNNTSDYIRVIDNTDTEEGPLPGTYTLSGGTNGIPTTPGAQADLLVGTPQSQTGLYTLSNPEAIDLDLVAIPGVSTTRVILALIDFCENQRQDCIAIIDPPLGMSADDVIRWHNGQHFLNLTKLDSSFGTLFWPWVKIRDKWNGIDVWIPPSGSVMGAFSISDRDYGVWYPPAGAEMGVMPRVQDVEVIPFQQERDRLYGGENAVNPIIKRPGGEAMIWGQKSLYRRSTALNRIGVRRLLLHIKKILTQEAQRLLFRPHTEKLRNDFLSIASKFLEGLRVREAFYSYQVECSQKLNPPEVIDRNELRARIGIRPTKSGEFLYVEMVVQNTRGEPDRG